jgi:hypothetical protein
MEPLILGLPKSRTVSYLNGGDCEAGEDLIYLQGKY